MGVLGARGHSVGAEWQPARVAGVVARDSNGKSERFVMEG